MFRQWTIRFAVALAALAFSVQPASSQIIVRPEFFPFVPFYPYPWTTLGGFGGYGLGAWGGYYSPGVYTPSLGNAPYYSGWSGYSAPVTLAPGWGAGSWERSKMRSTLTPAVAVVPADSPLLLAAWDEPTGDSRAVVVVVVPNANARVTVQGVAMTLTGSVRRFITPPLDANKGYEYDIRAQWTDAQGLQEETQTVQVRAGGVVNVVFASKNRR